MGNRFIVTDAEDNLRLDKLMTFLLPNMSRQKLQTLIKEQSVSVNDTYKKANYKCKKDDVITWKEPEEVMIEPIKAENIPLDILFEDEAIIVVNKPKGMIVHPTETIRSGTLVNALLFHSPQLSTLSGEDRPGIVHRLDQDTSGLLLVAKTNDAHANLKEQFQKRTVKRVYEALVSGHLRNERGIIRAPIGRDAKNRMQMTVLSSGREAETHFVVKEYVQDATIVQCSLVTGRTHQIRVHMKYINHPIVGDKVYGLKRNQKDATGQALYAKQIGFEHPSTKEWMEFEIDRPAYFENLLQSFR